VLEAWIVVVAVVDGAWPVVEGAWLVSVEVA
jgi:hypothetical protein